MWPNLLRGMQKRNIPVILANARLSPRSEQRYRKIKWLTRWLWDIPSRYLVSSGEDARRWQSIGVPGDRIHVTGNIKYDQSTGARADEQIENLRHIWQSSPLASCQPVVLAASTHPGEELLIAKTCRSLTPSFPNLGVIIVPRHAERSLQVREELASAGFPVLLRSSLPLATTPDPIPPESLPILLVDGTGELASWQHLADIVMVGKSFLAHGGQNPAEAVIAGKPVLFGPNMENFQSLVELLLASGAAEQVPDSEALASSLARWLAQPATGKLMADKGKSALLPHEGAARRTAEWILRNRIEEEKPNQKTTPPS
jgi:3-deoxy-D-manno-octulosonic-acid transferase